MIFYSGSITERLYDGEDTRLSHPQRVITNMMIKEGWDAYLEEYSDYTYVILVKEVKDGVQRINRAGHNIYVPIH